MNGMDLGLGEGFGLDLESQRWDGSRSKGLDGFS